MLFVKRKPSARALKASLKRSCTKNVLAFEFLEFRQSLNAVASQYHLFFSSHKKNLCGSYTRQEQIVS